MPYGRNAKAFLESAAGKGKEKKLNGRYARYAVWEKREGVSRKRRRKRKRKEVEWAALWYYNK